MRLASTQADAWEKIARRAGRGGRGLPSSMSFLTACITWAGQQIDERGRRQPLRAAIIVPVIETEAGGKVGG